MNPGFLRKKIRKMQNQSVFRAKMNLTCKVIGTGSFSGKMHFFLHLIKVFLDHQAFVDPGFLTKKIRKMQNHPLICYGNTVNML